MAFSVPAIAYSQINKVVNDLNFGLEPLEDGETWAVFVVPGPAIEPSERITTGTGQVTLVTSLDFGYTNLVSHAGTWEENARVNGPMEAPKNAYLSFGFVTDDPKIKLATATKTLLFTFVPTTHGSAFHLIDNVNDPFASPNTYGSNPGNDLGIIDFSRDGTMLAYGFGTNLIQAKAASAIFASQNGSTKPATTAKAEGKVIFVSEKNKPAGPAKPKE